MEPPTATPAPHRPAPRYRLLLPLLALPVVLLAPRAAQAAPADRVAPAKLDEAVDRGLARLAGVQHADGSFDVDPRDEGAPLALSKDGCHALTGLSVLAFLS